MINVCLVAPVPPPIGGIALWTSNIINYQQNDVNFMLINISPKINSSKKRNKILTLLNNFNNLCKAKHELKRVLKKNAIDCVHITTSGALSFIRDNVLIKVCKKFNVKVIVHFHFGRTKDILKYKSIEQDRLLRVVKNSSEIICMDYSTFNALKHSTQSLTNIKCIPNPIAYKSSYICQSNKQKVILFVGWVVSTKGIEELISAWNIVGKYNLDWKLKIIGFVDDKYLEFLKSISSVENIEFVGELSHECCISQIQQSSILVLPSYAEGFPNVVLEAMMASTVVIATNVGEIPKILSNNSGIVINHHSVEDIISALEELINDQKKREELASNAYKRVNENYTIDRVFDMLLKEWGDNK